jgi:hypothetical protein
MKSAIRKKLEQLAFRLQEVDALLSSEDAARDMQAFRRLALERAEIEPAARLYARYLQVEADLRQAEAMRSDPEMRALAEEEIATAKTGLPELELELQKLLLPRDPDDTHDILLEIEARTSIDDVAPFVFPGWAFRAGTAAFRTAMDAAAQIVHDVSFRRAFAARTARPGCRAAVDALARNNNYMPLCGAFTASSAVVAGRGTSELARKRSRSSRQTPG